MYHLTVACGTMPKRLKKPKNYSHSPREHVDAILNSHALFDHRLNFLFADIVREGRQARRVLQELSGNLREPLVSKLEEAALHGERAAEAMILHNVGLVAGFIKKCVFGNPRIRRIAKRSHIEYEDLVPIGVVGLQKAVERYDPERDVLFSTYARYWVRQAIFMYLADNGSHIRVPRSLIGQLRKTEKIIAFVEMHRRKPTKEELNAVLGEASVEAEQILDSFDDHDLERVRDDVRKKRNGVTAAGQILSLSMPVGENEGQTLGDLLASQGSDPESSLFRREFATAVLEAVSSLSKRDQVIVEGRLFHKRELRVIGEDLCVSGENVRQLAFLAFRRLIEHMRSSAIDSGYVSAFICYLTQESGILKQTAKFKEKIEYLKSEPDLPHRLALDAGSGLYMLPPLSFLRQIIPELRTAGILNGLHIDLLILLYSRYATEKQSCAEIALREKERRSPKEMPARRVYVTADKKINYLVSEGFSNDTAADLLGLGTSVSFEALQFAIPRLKEAGLAPFITERMLVNATRLYKRVGTDDAKWAYWLHKQRRTAGLATGSARRPHAHKSLGEKIAYLEEQGIDPQGLLEGRPNIRSVPLTFLRVFIPLLAQARRLEDISSPLLVAAYKESRKRRSSDALSKWLKGYHERGAYSSKTPIS